jgi:hypothetical protein
LTSRSRNNAACRSIARAIPLQQHNNNTFNNTLNKQTNNVSKQKYITSERVGNVGEIGNAAADQ